MKIFVSGATGFIGSHFLRAALQVGHEVTALRQSPMSTPRIHIEGAVAWRNGRLNDVSSDDLRGHDALVHLAAAGVELTASWQKCFEVNVTQSLDLWIKAADAGVRRFVICGSCFEYGKSGERYEFIPTDAPLEPTGPYHASKAAATMAALALAKTRKLNLTILRPFHVYGEGEAPGRFWPSLREAALAGRDFPMTAGEQVRDFQPVEETVQCFLREVENMATFEDPPIKNLGTGTPATLLQFAKIWWEIFQAKGRLLVGEKPYREGEVMRYVPLIN